MKWPMKNLLARPPRPTVVLVAGLAQRARKLIRAPSGFEGYLSRRQAAAALGLASDYKVRQFEREGRLRPVRGAMGSAWYPRSEVMALGLWLRSAADPDRGGAASRRGWSDGDLIALLRQPRPEAGGPRTVVDLLAETGVSIARAERVYRFWLARDDHPLAAAARGEPAERRSPERLARDALIRRLRDPDPGVRSAAFEALKRL